MKNLKGIVFGFIAMVAMIGGVSAQEACNGQNYHVKGVDDTYACANTLVDAIKNVPNGGEIVLLNESQPGSAITIDKDVTIDLNGHKMNLTNTLTVKGANVTIKHGTLTAAAAKLIVDSSEKASTLTIANDMTVTGTGGSSAFIKVLDATKDTVINVNGEWTLKNEIVDCTRNDKKLVINLNANITANALQTNALVSIDQGSSIVNVNGGSYVSSKMAFELVKGTLNINAGTIEAKEHAIYVKSTSADPSALNIAGGVITSTGANTYSVRFSSSGSGNARGTYKFTGGTFTSGQDGNGNQLPAISIGDPTFLTNHPKMISGGSFTKAIVGDVPVENNLNMLASAAEKILIGDAGTSEDENGNVIVGTPNTNDDQNQVIDGDNIGGTTDSGEANPNTADVNLMTLVGTILVGLAGFAYTMKNRLFN